ncbi:HAD family hydrolase [Kitasatospora sp. NPDC088783]|uniref:HAD family hydrolase n=1 Tax=Kitasatospora sp. NPDC088783 TaxID=3364077 RepID=UPI0038181F60
MRLLAVNDSLTAIGQPHIDLPLYRDAFCIPVPDFYARLIGRPLSGAEWELADHTYQDAYRRYQHEHTTLMPGAHDALEGWRSAGGTQSLVSLHHHQELVDELHQHGIAHYFTKISGRLGPTGGTKSRAMVTHIQHLAIPRRNIVAIGDTADDALAAQIAGIRVVLYTGGASSARELADTGAPLVDSLTSALGVAAYWLAPEPGTC